MVENSITVRLVASAAQDSPDSRPAEAHRGAHRRYNLPMTASIDITLNGERQSLDDGYTAQRLVDLLTLSEQRIAIEINGEIVPRSTFAERRIAAGDRIEIVRAVGGG